MKRSASIIILLLVCCGTVAAQVVQTPNGSLEFVGLERWDIATLEQRLGYDWFAKLSCNGRHDLTARLGFADAQCVSYVKDGRPYKVITVLEPQAVARVNYFLEPEASLPTPSTWSDIRRIVEEETFLNTIADYGSKLDGAVRRDTVMPEEDRVWFTFLQERRTDEDYRLACIHLATDGDFRNRIVAALVLMNFGYRDIAWQGLMHGLRDANEIVRSVCAQSLLSLMRYTPRRVDWRASVGDLNILLSGTNLCAYSWSLELVVATKISPELAHPLLKGKASDLLLDHLNASHDRERELAHRLLVRLSGIDLGYDTELWHEWITTGSVTPTPALLANKSKAVRNTHSRG